MIELDSLITEFAEEILEWSEIICSTEIYLSNEIEFAIEAIVNLLVKKGDMFEDDLFKCENMFWASPEEINRFKLLLKFILRQHCILCTIENPNNVIINLSRDWSIDQSFFGKVFELSWVSPYAFPSKTSIKITKWKVEVKSWYRAVPIQYDII